MNLMERRRALMAANNKEITWTTDGIAVNNEPNGDLVVTTTSLGAYAFAGKTKITSIVLENMTLHGQYPFYGCTGIKKIVAPKLKQSYEKFFPSALGLEDVSFPSLTTINNDQFIEGSKILNLVLPSFSGNVYRNSLRMNWSLRIVDFAACTNIEESAFLNCSSLDTVIIRGSTVATLSKINAFSGTKFASGKAGGTLYVKEALIESYQSASNWSTILGYANNKIAAIEGSEYEHYYADGTPI